MDEDRAHEATRPYDFPDWCCCFFDGGALLLPRLPAAGASTVLLLSTVFGALVDVLAAARGFFTLRARGLTSDVAGADDFAATGFSVATGLVLSAAFCFTLANAGADRAKIETRTADKIVRMMGLLAGEQRRAKLAYRIVRRVEDTAACMPHVSPLGKRALSPPLLCQTVPAEAVRQIPCERVRRSC